MDEEVTDGYPIVSADLTVEALRENGYKSTAYALAELIDNAIEAEADLIELIVVEEQKKASERMRYQVERIGVLDNGTGMNPVELRTALRVGAGTRRERKGIGRFGVGLPNSSLSQCTRVDVWSWQNGPANALHTYLDLEEIRNGMREVPVPALDPIPPEWLELGEGFGPTGTLVVWSQLDKVKWRQADTTLRNTEDLIGRIYRKYLNGQCRIRLVPARSGESALFAAEAKDARPNDPMYLTVGSTAPAPFDKEPMFEPFGAGSVGEIGVEKFDIPAVDGTLWPVYVRTSVARDAARLPDQDVPWPTNVSPTQNPGATPWGTHAKKNQGISLIRKGRELTLDTGLVNTYDPTERFWGIEVDFPPQLDEVFGVTNNKQSATIFSELTAFEYQDEAEGMSYHEYREMALEEDPQLYAMIELVRHIKRLLSAVRSRLTDQTANTRANIKRHAGAQKRANEALKKMRRTSAPTLTEQLGADKTQEEIKEAQKETLIEIHHYKPAEAEQVVEETSGAGLSAGIIEERNPESPAFFGIDFVPGLLQVVLNRDHPVFDQLFEVLENDISNLPPKDLAARLARAAESLKLVLMAWARYEDQLPNEKARQRAKEMRQDWGRIVKGMLTADDDDDEDEDE